MSWWITFHDGSAACIELPPDSLPTRASYEELAEMLPAERKEYHETWNAELLVHVNSQIDNLELNKQVVKIQRLPYPAEPRIGPYRSGTPAFCMSPNQCAGFGACPRRYSCTE